MDEVKNYAHLFSLKNPEEEMIRVDHAGELGAKYIYLGQLKALKGDREILEMLEGELTHLDFFEEEISKRGVRPSLLNPLWKHCAFAMGYLTALGSRKAAMLCTEKVETVIASHYGEQISILEENTPQNCELIEKLKKFKEDELEHLHIGRASSMSHKMLGNIITFCTKTAIKSSKIL